MNQEPDPRRTATTDAREAISRRQPGEDANVPRQYRSSAARFPAPVNEALRAAGWEPGRRDIAQAEVWADTLRAHESPAGHRHHVHPAAVEAWAEFGTLPISATTTGREIAPASVLIDPLRILHTARTLADLGRALDTEIAPLGDQDDGSGFLAIDREGRVFGIDHTGDWYLGEDLGAALTTLLTGLSPARLRPAEDSTDGMDSTNSDGTNSADSMEGAGGTDGTANGAGGGFAH